MKTLRGVSRIPTLDWQTRHSVHSKCHWFELSVVLGLVARETLRRANPKGIAGSEQRR